MADNLEEQSQIEKLIRAYRRRLNALEEQEARGEWSAARSIEIEDIKEKLADLRAQLQPAQPASLVVKRPYKGLETFGEADAEFFFGREQLVQELLAKLADSTFLAVLGASGSGKSSVVLAGLLPALREGALPGSEQWHYATMKPTARPLRSLASALGQGTLAGDDALLRVAEQLLTGRPDARLLLVVDQAEELWTVARNAPDQRSFIQMLLAAANTPATPLCVVLTMRADFLHRALENTDMGALLNSNTHFVSPMSEGELRAVIERPAAALDHSFETGLIEKLVEQTRNQPGALPLLEHLLAELWIDRDAANKRLTWAAFNARGGVDQALARHADAILDRHYAAYGQQEQLRSVLLRLVRPGDEVDTRRRVPLADLAFNDTTPEQIQILLDPLVHERLLTAGRDDTTGETTVEVAHEALIRSWPTLREWVDEARADLRFHIQLADAAKVWIENDENKDFLWKGKQLDTVDRWRERGGQLNRYEKRFLSACHSVAKANAAQDLVSASSQTISDGMLVCDLDGTVLSVNPAAERILQRSIESLLTQNMHELLVSLAIKRAHELPLADLLQRPVDRYDQPRIFHATFDIGPRTVSVTLGPVLTENQELVGALAMFHDLTREVESDRLKTEFIGTMSHELRTPMTSIKGFTQLLAMGSLGPVNETQREFLNTIFASAERMISIINDVLDITQIETNSVELDLRPIYMADSISSIIADIQAAIMDRSHTLIITVPPDLPLVVADARRLQQILRNLLQNAIKYTPQQGRIEIQAQPINFQDMPSDLRDRLTAGRTYVQIDITDTGVGIAPEDQTRIFERFYRTENPLRVEADGTGLGLSLVRPLIELLGGRIWLESVPGEGSTFSFVLPATQSYKLE